MAHPIRLTILIPDARKAAITTWWVANIDPNGANTFSVGLSASGDPPYTHWWASTALTVAEFMAIADRLCQMASIQFPPQGWAGMTLRQKRHWLEDQYPAIRTATNIRLRLGDNDGDWNDPQQARRDESLKDRGG